MLDVCRLGGKMGEGIADYIIGSQADDGLENNTTHEFLRRKCHSISQLDIATGYFEFSALNYLGTQVWSSIDKIRILIGNGTSAGARNQIVRIQESVESIIGGIGKESKESESGKAIYRAFQENRIEFKIYEGERLFHPKLYLAQPKSGSSDSNFALVGSSNFSRNGISSNVELNVCIEEKDKVDKLQQWFETAWKLGKEVTKKIEDEIPPEWRSSEWNPYPVFLKAMAGFFGSNQTLTGNWYQKEKSIAEGNLNYSQMWPILDEYQREAFQDLSKYAENWNGAFLCDGVGLGKTYTGLMLIEKFTFYDNKRVLLISPKSVHDSVWVDKIETMLKHVPNNKIEAIKTTDLTSFDDSKISSFKDVEMVIIDEAHHFRNPNSQRYQQLQRIIQTGLKKQVFFLTATPINNDVYDLYYMIKLFINEDEKHFKSAGIPHLLGHFKQLKLDINEGKKIGEDKIIREIIVQRSRSYVKESMKIEKRNSVFPEPTPPKSITFKPSQNYLKLLGELEKAFKANKEKGKESLLNFSIYNPYDHYIGSEEDKDEMVNKGSVVGLMGSSLLKRLESSTRSFHMSCYKLLLKNLSWLDKFDSRKNSNKILDEWKKQNKHVLVNPSPNQFVDEEDDSDSLDFDFNDFELKVWPEKDWDVQGIVKDTYEDIDVIASLISATIDINPKDDNKIDALVKVLNSKDMSASGKVVIFTEFVSTAEFLKMELDNRIEGKVISVIHSNTSEERKNVIKRFSPYYNGSSPQQLACSCDGNGYDANGEKHPDGCHPEEEIDILISTDVLSEGLNLQDSVKLINFDIHWNPVKLMQRIGRIDRRLNPDIEKQIMGNHPERKADRGKIAYWNCLPPQELEQLIGLQKVVEHKFEIIATLLGVEGGFGLTTSQNLHQLHDLYTNSEFSFGSSNLIDSMDPLRLEYNKMLQDDMSLISHPALAGFDNDAPHSDKEGDGQYAFFSYLIPRKFDDGWGEEAYDKGECKWYLYNFENSQILHERSEMEEIFNIIKSISTEKRVTSISKDEIEIAKNAVRHYCKNSIMRTMGLPQGVIPRLLCSMTIGGGN